MRKQTNFFLITLLWLRHNLISPDWLWFTTFRSRASPSPPGLWSLKAKGFSVGICLHTDYNQWIGMCVSSFYAESWSIFTVPFSVRAELEIDCRQWLVLPRCANSDLPFSISVSSTAGERCCMHFFFYGAQSGRGAFSQRSLPLRLPLSSLLSSTLTASFLIFFFFFNCLAGICMHEAN